MSDTLSGGNVVYDPTTMTFQDVLNGLKPNASSPPVAPAAAPSPAPPPPAPAAPPAPPQQAPVGPAPSVSAANPSMGQWLMHPIGSFYTWAENNAGQNQGFLNQNPPGTPGNAPPPGPAAPPAPPPAAPKPPVPAPPGLPGSGPGAVGPQGAPVAPPQPPAATPAPPPAPPPQAAPQAPPTQAQHYGAVLASMVPGESGGNPNAQNPNSTASGLQQFTDPTFQDFLKSPAGAGYTMGQKNTPQAQQAAGQWRMAQIDQQFQTQVGRPATDDELRAGMVLGPAGAATLAANPTGDALKTYAAVAGQGTAQAAFATNGAMLQPGMTSAQALASIGKHYAPGSAQMAAAPGGSPVAGAMGLAAAGPAASAVVGAQQQTPQQVQGLKDVGIPTIDPSLYRSSTSEKLFALSAGLFGAPSLGIGLSRGLGNVTGLMAQDRTNNLRAQSDIIAQARATAQINNQNAMFGLKSQPKPTGVTVPGPNGTDMQEMRDPTTGGLSYVPMPGMVAKDSNAQNRSAVVAGQLNGSTKANQTLAAETVKDTNDGIDNVVASGVNSAQKLQSINNFETLAQDPSSGAGPTLADHARRYLATQLGLGPVDASSAQLTDAMSKQLAAGGFAAIKGVQIKNQREFEFATGQIAKMDTDPRAIVPLIAPMKAAAQHDQNVYQAWRAMPVEQQNAMRTQPGQFQAWKAEQDAPYIDSLGVGGGTSQPTISKTSAGTWAPVTIGGKQVQIGNVSVTPN